MTFKETLMSLQNKTCFIHKTINFYSLSICIISGLFGTSYVIYKFPCSPFERTMERVKYVSEVFQLITKQTVKQKRNKSASHLFLLSV